MSKNTADQLVKCPVCNAMSYPLVNKSQIDFLKDGEEILLMCGACKRIMNPFFKLFQKYAAEFEELKKATDPEPEEKQEEFEKTEEAKVATDV